MASLDAVSITILLGAVLVLAGILSSLIALRFGAPLLVLFLIIGVAAGESGPGGIRFDDVHTAYTVGSIALALILFDGGLRTRLQTFRSVLAPAGLLATLGVLVTAALTAPLAKFGLGVGWIEGLLVGAMVGSTDAAAVFFLIHAGGLRLRPRAAAVPAPAVPAAYLAGLIVGNRRTRAHGRVVVFLDAVTWLAQIVMFVLLGLLVEPTRLASSAGPALLIAAGLMLVARPAAVFLCLAPFRFSPREKLFVSWVAPPAPTGLFLA